jgi:hypothetical protein
MKILKEKRKNKSIPMTQNNDTTTTNNTTNTTNTTTNTTYLDLSMIVREK